MDLAGAEKTYVFAKTPLNDPADYYGGRKEARVIQFGKFKRALSDFDGQYESASFSCIVDDKDRLIRGLLGGINSQYFRNRMVTIRMISDAARREG